MPKTAEDHSARDATILRNSYTTVLRRPGVPHDLFATYWRDVHGPLCSRLPGLGWYVQFHFDRERTAHAWPQIDGIEAFADYPLDGFVEIGFLSDEDQRTFFDASPILFTDEQNMFAATVAYDLPQGSTTLVDRIADPVPNTEGGPDRLQIHLGGEAGNADAFRARITTLAQALAGEDAVLKVRMHLPEVYDNADPAPPAPDVDHAVPPERRLLAILELAFETSLARRTFYASQAFAAATQDLGTHVTHAKGFFVSGVYTYVRDGRMTLAGLRGSRAAQLIETLGAVNQIQDDVWQAFRTGRIDAG